jgi:putative ABC transport system permease protein
MTIFYVSIRNLVRRPLRTGAMALALAALSGMLFSLTVLYISMAASLERGVDRLGADAMAVPSGWKEDSRGMLLSGGPVSEYMDAAVIDTIAGHEDVELCAGQLFIVSARLACCSLADTSLVGFDPETDLTITPWLKESLTMPLLDNDVVAGANILAEPGGKARFYGKLFVIAGKLEPTGLDVIDSTVFIPMKGARDMIARSGQNTETPLNIGESEISAVLIRFRQGADHERSALRIEHALPGVKVELSGEMIRKAQKTLLVPLKAAFAAVVVQWVVCMALTGVLYCLSVMDRRKEIALMRSMGSKKETLLMMFFLEVVIVSAAGAVLGIATGGGALAAFKGVLGETLEVGLVPTSAAVVAAIAAFTTAFTVLSALAAAIYPVAILSGKAYCTAVTSE